MTPLKISKEQTKENIKVKIIDFNNVMMSNLANFDEERSILQLCTEVKEFGPEIIGIGCMFSGSFKGLLAIARKVKDALPTTPIIVGGMHPTLYAGRILEKYSFIDYVLAGEGEQTFLEFIQ